MNACNIITQLGMQPHPEGGHYVETFRDEVQVNGRSAGTAIYFLLQAGEISRWHRVDATEIWHYYAGAPLELSIASADGDNPTVHMLGIELASGQLPQAVVPAHYWQSARSTGEWTLVGCTVSPGFEFAGFEMAPQGWAPSDVS